MHNLMKVYLPFLVLQRLTVTGEDRIGSTGFLNPPVILPINIDSTATGKKN